MNTKLRISICWFRRDLRWDDHTALWHALQSNFPVLPIFIFDPEILSQFPENDSRVHFIYNKLQELNKPSFYREPGNCTILQERLNLFSIIFIKRILISRVSILMKTMNLHLLKETKWFPHCLVYIISLYTHLKIN